MQNNRIHMALVNGLNKKSRVLKRGFRGHLIPSIHLTIFPRCIDCTGEVHNSMIALTFEFLFWKFRITYCGKEKG